MIDNYFKKGEFDSSIIGYPITSISFETAYPCGFNLIICVTTGRIIKRNLFFFYDRQNLEFLRPMELIGKKITNVEYFVEGEEGGIKITVSDGFWIWLKQI